MFHLITLGVLSDYCVFERMTLNWSTTSNIVWTYGQHNLKCISDRDLVYSSFEDISTIIKMRAYAQYGIKVQLFNTTDILKCYFNNILFLFSGLCR